MGSIPQVSVVRGGSFALPHLRNLARLFEDNALKTARSTAVIYEGPEGTVHKLTYSELDRAANRLARALLGRMRAVPGGGDAVVAVSLPPSDALLLTLLAVWKAGAAYLPLDQQAPQRVRHIVQEARPLLVITEEAEDMRDEPLRGQNVVSFATLDAEATKMADTLVSEAEALPSAAQPLGLVLYTSGSTGVPKGVRLPHAVVLNRLRWQWREFPYGSTERICVFKTTLTFVDAVSEIWGPLLHPAPLTLLVVPKSVTKDPQRLIPLLEQYKVERLLVVPTLLRAILLYLQLDKTHTLSTLKTWVCSGEPLAKSLALQFLDHFRGAGVRLCNFYGSTEVMGDVTFHVISDENDISFDKVPIGRPVDNTSIHLLDRQLNAVPPGTVGEMYVAGLNVCAGYVNNRDPHKFISNPHTVDPDMSRLYHTGDYARLVKGTLLYEGRTDSQVKVRGHRVDLAEVEAALQRLPEVDKTAVLCYRPGEVDQMVIAYLTLRPNVDTSSEDIETALQSHLAIYAIPQVLIVDSIPLLNNGKVDRQTLLKRYAEMGGAGTEGAPLELDCSELSEQQRCRALCLLRTVSTVLGGAARAKVCLDANFYHLGGNSLNSVFTVTKLRDQGYLIGITDFISAQTLREIVDKMVPEDKLKENGVLFSEEALKQKPFTVEIITNKHKPDVYRIIGESFYEKGDLEQLLKPRVKPADYIELLDKIWESMVKSGLSFILRSQITGEVAAVAISFDAYEEPEAEIEGHLKNVFEFLEYVEAPVREQKLPKGIGRVLHNYMMGTDMSLGAADNVVAMTTMEQETLALARRRGFAGIFTTNTSPLTKQLGTDVFDYKVLRELQVNKYVAADGSKPFAKAPDSFTVSCSWKPV